jgi:23S rRNA (adenine2503-C2)-methyltransferase
MNADTIEKDDIRTLSLEDLGDFFEQQGDKKFRARQVMEWLWKKSCTDFDEMTNLSKSVRELLKSRFEIRNVVPYQSQKSNDGTIKSVFKLYDGNIIEGVLIPADDRMTACISSQVGCSLSCKFCATGYMGRKRNLEAAEIYDQVVIINQLAQQHYDLP